MVLRETPVAYIGKKLITTYRNYQCGLYLGAPYTSELTVFLIFYLKNKACLPLVHRILMTASKPIFLVR